MIDIKKLKADAQKEINEEMEKDAKGKIKSHLEKIAKAKAVLRNLEHEYDLLIEAICNEQ